MRYGISTVSNRENSRPNVNHGGHVKVLIVADGHSNFVPITQN